jgi:ATP-dependent Lhr-like helicase
VTTSPDAGPESLQGALDRLFAFPAPVKAWEGEILPARLDPYYPSWLDSLLWESDLLWLGCGRERSTFLFREDLPLVAEEEPSDPDPLALELFPEPRMKIPLADLAQRSGLDPAQLTEGLWRLAWQGEISNASYATVRRAASNRFRAVSAAEPARPAATARRRSFRSGFDRWKASRPADGDWFRIERPSTEEGDALDREEWVKERVRVLLARYGVIFRELTRRELPAFSWGRIFRSLRLMELSGEILAGHFFSGVPGPQFISHAALRSLREGIDGDAIYWLSAIDPASPCGLGLEDLRGLFPERRAGNHVVFHGREVVATSRRNGRELELRVPPEHPCLLDYLGFLDHLLTRRVDPRRAIEIETINGERAAEGEWAARLAERFSVTREYRSLKLRRRYSAGG